MKEQSKSSEKTGLRSGFVQIIKEGDKMDIHDKVKSKQEIICPQCTEDKFYLACYNTDMENTLEFVRCLRCLCKWEYTRAGQVNHIKMVLCEEED